MDLTAAHAFVRAHARILDQRRLDGDVDGVVHAVLAYRNPDGGFGHGLEPDTRDPNSQPLYAQVALESVASVGARLPDDVLLGLCDHLADIGDPGLPIMVPSFVDHPRADHWQGVSGFPPGLNPTAALAGLLTVEHPWVDAATQWCLDRLADGPPDDAHTARCVALLLERVDRPDLADRLFEALPTARMYRADPADPEYGLTPLDYAAAPDSPWRERFDDALVDAHLEALAAEQQPDGGWPIRWEPPTEPSTWEWRGMVTVSAINTLTAYGV